MEQTAEAMPLMLRFSVFASPTILMPPSAAAVMVGAGGAGSRFRPVFLPERAPDLAAAVE